MNILKKEGDRSREREEKKWTRKYELVLFSKELTQDSGDFK